MKIQYASITIKEENVLIWKNEFEVLLLSSKSIYYKGRGIKSLRIAMNYKIDGKFFMGNSIKINLDGISFHSRPI